MYVWCAFLTYNNDLDMLEFSSSKCWHASRYMAMARVCVHHFIRNAKLVGYNGCGRSKGKEIPVVYRVWLCRGDVKGKEQLCV